ncbi:MAG: hypothetical protein WBQ81_15700, partial [Candidatus Sulfotelmatobacter sp.]
MKRNIARATLVIFSVAAIWGAAALPALAQSFPSEPTFTTFEAPGAGTGAAQGTVPFSINTAGAIAGMYYDANNAYHGFVR